MDKMILWLMGMVASGAMIIVSGVLFCAQIICLVSGEAKCGAAAVFSAIGFWLGITVWRRLVKNARETLREDAANPTPKPYEPGKHRIDDLEKNK